ncbi:hypothetical protein JW711_06340 [Candidatus Woesearchaeota archaeon]|nr:hypothetical protein [Candidatus Woesearchaeota archaeon]
MNTATRLKEMENLGLETILENLPRLSLTSIKELAMKAQQDQFEQIRKVIMAHYKNHHVPGGVEAQVKLEKDLGEKYQEMNANIDAFMHFKPLFETIIPPEGGMSAETEMKIYDLIVKSRIRHKMAKAHDKTSILLPHLLGEAYGEYLNGKQSHKNKSFSEVNREIDDLINIYGHKPAYIIVLNYDQPKHQIHIHEGYFSNGQIQRERGEVTYLTERMCIGKFLLDPAFFLEIMDISYEDSALLISAETRIIGTNAEMKFNVDVPHAMGSLNQITGIHGGGSNRQRASLFGSKTMPGTVIYSLSETGIIRRFYMGELTRSTHQKEVDWLMEKQRL